MLLGIVPSFAATYYMSNSGNDTNTGLTTLQAWATLAKVNAATFVPGDQILFERGSTFYGSITVKKSGLAGKPITFGAYGTGANPVITGFTSVTTWKNIGNNIWESANPVSTLETCNMVVINGVNTAMGRYPNADAPNGGYLTFQSHSGTTSITSSSLTGKPNWTGAEVVIRPNRWTLERSLILSQSGSLLSFESKWEPIDGFGFFIQNDIRTLDIQNEWYYNPTTKKMSIYSVTMPTHVNVTSTDVLMFIPGSYVVVENMNFLGSNSNSVFIFKNWTTRAHHNTVKNCEFLFSGGVAIGARGDYTLIENNDILESNFSAIDADKNPHVVIKNNNIKNTFLLKGKYRPAAIIASYDMTSLIIEGNRVINCGTNGISAEADSTMLIKNNFIDTFNTILDDGGGLYLGGNNQYGIKISGNVCINGIGNGFGTTDSNSSGSRGIYLDDNCVNFEVSYNTVANIGSYGIFVHNSDYNNIHHNTVYNSARGQIVYQNNMDHSYMVENSTHDNIFVSKANQPTLVVSSQYNNIINMGTFNNNYYARPIDDNLTVTIAPAFSTSKKNLAQWQTYSGRDANSRKSPIAIKNDDDLKFEYNATKEPKILNIDVPMMDVTGAKYFGKLTLQPFTSVVLIKDTKTPIVTTEYRTICEGNTYNGWTKSGIYERKEISASGDYALVTTILTVTPVQKVTENITVNEGAEYQGWKQAGTYTRKLLSVGGCDSIVTTNLQVVVNTTKEADLETNQTIGLVKGFNLISTYIAAPNADASEITKALREQNLLVKLQDEAGHSFENWGSYGGWVNKIGVLENTEGYQIQVANDCTLQVSGISVNLPLDISLKTGWNIISFPRTDWVNAMDIIQPLIDQNVLVKVQDEAGNSIEDWGVFGGWKNGIGNFSPGKAYKVQLKADAMLTIQENYPKSALVLAQTEKTEYFVPRVEGNGTDHMNINIAGLSNAGIAIGDELAAFDGDICVGSVKITEANLSNLSLSLIASFSTDNLNPNGFKVGNPVQIYIWNKQTDEKSKVNAEVINGQMNYEKSSSVLINLKSLSTGVTDIDKTITIDVFPNPSNGLFTVRLSELPDSGSRIDLLDISGRKISSRLVTQTSEAFNLGNQAPGLYLVKTTMGSKGDVRKLIIN